MLKSKRGKVFLGILILIHVVSFAICSFDSYGMGGHPKNGDLADFHCGGDLRSFVQSEDRNSLFVNLPTSLTGLPQIAEPHLPILLFSIFRPPKPAKTFL